MDLLGDYFSDYFDEAVTPVAAASSSVSIFDTAQVRYLVFRIGQLRFALRRSDIVSVSSAPDFGCHFLDPRVMVPTRYADAAAASGEQSSYVQLAGLPYGFGPCRIDEDITLPRDALNARATASASSPPKKKPGDHIAGFPNPSNVLVAYCAASGWRASSHCAHSSPSAATSLPISASV